MSHDAVALESFVNRYLSTVSGGSAADVAALYAEDATLEDPVGSGEVHIGRHAIEGFYKNLTANLTASGGGLTTELLQFRPGGHEAAFMFAIVVAGAMRIEPIEVMAFDADGQITSMKAYWSQADIKPL